MSAAAFIFLSILSAVIAVGLYQPVVNMTKRVGVQHSHSEYEISIRNYVIAVGCAALPASFDEDDLIAAGALNPSFDDHGLTWTAQPDLYSQVLVTVSGDNGVEKSLIRDMTNAVTNPGDTISFRVAVGSSNTFHPGYRAAMSYHKVDNTCAL